MDCGFSADGVLPTASPRNDTVRASHPAGDGTGGGCLLRCCGSGECADVSLAPGQIIVPFPAGGTADVMPRLFTDWLARKWGQPVVIENRTGAGGNIGAEAVAKSEPDGYTLLAAPPPPLVINQNLYPKLGFDPTEFSPVVIMGRVPNALVVNPKLSVQQRGGSDCAGQEQSRQAHVRHPGQRHHLASHFRDVPDDGQRALSANSLSRLGPCPCRPRRRQCRPDV